MNIEVSLKEIIELFANWISCISPRPDFVIGIVFGVITGFFICAFLFFFYKDLKYKRNSPITAIHNKITLTIEDGSGNKAHYKKEQLARPNWEGITSYIEHSIFATGETANFQTSVGKIEDVYHISGIKHVKIGFDKPLKKKPFTRFFEYDILNSFSDRHNYHLHKINAYENKLTFEIIFPSARPPRNPKVFQSIGVAEIEEKDPEIINLANGKTMIRWEKKRHLLYPLQIGNIFKIEWDW